MRNASMAILLPPSIQSTFSFFKKVRYHASAGITDGTVTAVDLARLLGMGITVSSLASLIASIQFCKIEIWSPAVVGAITAFSFKQENTTFIGSPSKTESDICVSTAAPAHVKGVPPPNSLSGFWVQGVAASTAPVVTLTVAEDSVVDFTFQFVLIGDGNDPGSVFTVSAAVIGVIYLRTLCSGDLVPVSFPGTS